MSNPKLLKASGITEEFSAEKLRRSLETSKVPADLIPQAIQFIQPHLKDGSTTGELHELTRRYLEEQGLIANAFDYDLRRAVMRLGPSGYPFENYFADLLTARGYTTAVGVIITGFCVSHEVDIDAHYQDRHILIECKYHNQPGTKTDIQATLYTYARYLDIKEAREKQAEHQDFFHETWLVTNTKVTKDAIDYAVCRQMKLVSWSYPQEGNLKQMILQTGLYPVTSLISLSDQQLTHLLNRKIVTCAQLKDVLDRDDLPDLISPQQRTTLLTQLSRIRH